MRAIHYNLGLRAKGEINESDVRRRGIGRIIDALHSRTPAVAEGNLEGGGKIADNYAAKIQERIDGGKGTWPDMDYVKDETFAAWRGERYATGEIAREIRSMVRAAPQPPDAPPRPLREVRKECEAGMVWVWYLGHGGWLCAT